MKEAVAKTNAAKSQASDTEINNAYETAKNELITSKENNDMSLEENRLELGKLQADCDAKHASTRTGKRRPKHTIDGVTVEKLVKIAVQQIKDDGLRLTKDDDEMSKRSKRLFEEYTATYDDAFASGDAKKIASIYLRKDV